MARSTLELRLADMLAEVRQNTSAEVDQLRDALDAWLGARGFGALSLEHTGGGCDCWAAYSHDANGPHVRVWVTDSNSNAPSCDADPVLILIDCWDKGIAEQDEASEAIWHEFDNAAAALAAVALNFDGVEWSE